MSVLVVHGHRDYGPEITEECERRVRRAERLVHSSARAGKPIKLLVFSGAGRNEFWPSEAKQMALSYRGPKVPFVLEECSRSTVENALWTVGLLNEWGCDLSELRLVTSWWHAPRVWSVWRSVARGSRVRVVPSQGDWRYLVDELVPMVRSLVGAVRWIGTRR